VVAARDVAYRYPGAERDVREPYDLTLHAGEATVLTGPNGSGKSTLAMLVAGLRRPSRGEVLAVGRGEGPLHRWRAKALSGLVGTVFQEPEHQFLTRTVRDELALGLPAGDRGADALMERLRLSHLAGANPFTLSGGEKRRLSVATALTGRPQALVLDEPTFGQDASTWAELLDLLAALRDQGTAVLAVSHDLMFAECLADREIRLGQAA
jgi:energy-coupling factor transport system ATP-binding protein